jgi:hypothetical protein
MTARTATAGIIAAAALFVAIPGAGAASSNYPHPDGVAPGEAYHARVVQLTQDRRNATTVAERRPIHLELIQTLRDGE